MVSTGQKVDTWERLGYESYGAWLRACAKARRAAIKKAAPPPPAKWHVPQVAPGNPDAMLAPPPTPFGGLDDGCDDVHLGGCLPGYDLPGRMRDDVLFTPRGRREHKLKHVSPGGTTRCDEYSSPAGVESAWQERHACLERLRAARIKDRDERKAEEKSGLYALLRGEAVQGPARCPAVLSEHIKAKEWEQSGYGDTCRKCEACNLRAHIRKQRKARGDVVPCRVKLARLGYTNAEQDMMYDQLVQC